jgi:NADP-dependent 3-hydroxy acid dehydrogenase YdfG
MDKCMSTEFKGLTAAVTGAGSGIGLATLKILADGGATVYGLDIAEGGIAEHGTWLQCDVGDDASVSAAFAKISKLDILINSAAISAVGTVESNPSEEWHKVMNINVVGIVRTVREALPLLRKSDCASVTNVCSVAATAGIPKRALYSASKGAVLSLTMAMANDHIVDGVLQVRECEYDLFHNKRSSNATVHKFILGQDDCHFSMFFVNKVMGPPLTSDKEDVMNEADQCIQHSASGKELNH